MYFFVFITKFYHFFLYFYTIKAKNRDFSSKFDIIFKISYHCDNKTSNKFFRRFNFMKKILLLCAAGMSTSLLVTKMKNSAKEKGIKVEIEACPVEKFIDKLPIYDTARLGSTNTESSNGSVCRKWRPELVRGVSMRSCHERRWLADFLPGELALLTLPPCVSESGERDWMVSVEGGRMCWDSWNGLACNQHHARSF